LAKLLEKLRMMNYWGIFLQISVSESNHNITPYELI
jgi:hypothetical protein